MSNLGNYGIPIQQNTLNELQILNMQGFKQQSVVIDVLFGVLIALIIGYLVWTRNTNK